MSQQVQHPEGRARLATWASLALGLAGVLLFGSVVGAVGSWMEGRQLRTIAPWAVPGLVLAVVAGVVAIRALRTGKDHQVAVALGLAVATSMVLLVAINPSIAPPVP